jgi:large subunit ribosomal protein L32
MPVPKQRLGKSDKRARRANWKALPTAVTFCVNCGSPKLTHGVCTVCGFYNGRIVSPRFAKKSGYDQIQSRLASLEEETNTTVEATELSSDETKADETKAED